MQLHPPRHHRAALPGMRGEDMKRSHGRKWRMVLTTTLAVLAILWTVSVFVMMTSGNASFYVRTWSGSVRITRMVVEPSWRGKPDPKLQFGLLEIKRNQSSLVWTPSYQNIASLSWAQKPFPRYWYRSLLIPFWMLAI